MIVGRAGLTATQNVALRGLVITLIEELLLVTWI